MDDSSAELLDRLTPALSDRYRIIRLVGEGGMAMVYLAEDLRHQRTVAIKVLKPDLTHSVGAERFLREINTSARLNHPHILPLLDSGRAGSLLFYVMPYVEGESLRDRFDRSGTLPLDEAIRFIGEIADALGYAHKAGVVHRDIKPENVMISSGHAVITDFGIARALDEAADSRLTHTGGSTGTPYYMSPEQWDGSSTAEFDGRSDQYALGCVAFEILAGIRPYTAQTSIALMMQHATAPIPSVRAIRPDVPEHVDAAIRTALAKSPDHRFATAEGFAAALRSPSSAVATPVTIPVTGPVPTSRTSSLSQRLTRNAIRAGAMIIVLVIGGYIGYRLTSGGDNASGPKRLAVLPFQNQGPSEDAYFADGVSEEITNRLSSIASLAVIARTSAAQYRGSTKTPRQIGVELGVDYLIEGTVRWGGSSGPKRPVRVNARLIRASDGDVLFPYDTTATVDDVFAIQTGIAERVTQKLSLVLLEPERRRLSMQPTENIEAYRNYLAGNVAYDRSWARQDVETALASYQKAVELDPKFALAWAKIARTHAWIYQLRYDRTPDRLAMAKEAADRAVTLDPGLSEAHLSLGLYWYWGLGDYERALAELAKAGQLQASNAQVYQQIGNVRRRQGRFPEAVASYRKSADLNPRYHLAWFNYGETSLFLRSYAQAAPALARVTDLAPAFFEGYVQRARLAISARGDIEGARRMLRLAEERIPPTAWRASMLDFARVIYGPNLQGYLSRLRPGTYGLDSGTYHLVKGRFLRQMGRPEATTQFDSARVLLENMLEKQPSLAWIRAELGMAYAGLGRADEAAREAKQAMALQPVSKDALDGPDLLINVADVYALLGNADSAAVYYDRALAIPSWISINSLRADPLLTSFRSTPQFKRLADKWSKPRAVAQAPSRASSASRRLQMLAATATMRDARTRTGPGKR